MAALSDRDALPPELIRDILSHCTPDVLCKAGLVSKAFQTDSETLLYHSILLSRANQHLMLYNTLIGCPRKAQRVQHLSIDGLFTGNDLSLLLLLLPNLTALEILNSSFGRGFGVPLPEFPFRLRRLVVTDDGVGLLNCDFDAFMEQQQRLEYLQLSFESESILAPLCKRAVASGDVFLPALRAIEATPNVLLALVKGGRRPITSISTYHAARHYPGGADFVLTLSRAVAAGNADIVALNLSTRNVWETMLQLTSSGAFPRLRSLEIMINASVRVRKLKNDLSSERNEPLHLHLKRLIIHVGLYGLLRHDTEQILRSSIPLLKNRFPGLEKTPVSCAFILHYLGDPTQSFWASPTRTISQD